MSLSGRYAELLGPLAYGDTEAFLGEVRELFQLGADPALLADDERIDYAAQVQRVRRAHRESTHPWAWELYRSRLADRDLDITDGGGRDGHGLGDEEREFFARYGLLPARRVQSLSRNGLAKIDHCVRRVCGTEPVGTSVAYLFCKPLFDLVMNAEIVGRVTSLLGPDVTCVGTSGPMYVPPGGVGTPWHFAGGADFGSAGGSSLDLVTCWLALSDVPRQRAPMKMLTRSHASALAFHDAANELHDRPLDQLSYRIDDDVLASMVARRLNSKRIPELQFQHDGELRYNPFHERVDALTSVGPDALREGPSLEMIAMEAQAGDVYLFSSLNVHGSLSNDSNEWRRAIAIRYVKSGSALANRADNHYELLKTYRRLFPEIDSVFQHVDKRIDDFAEVCPRVAVSGRVPAEVAEYYWDVERLRGVLRERPILGLPLRGRRAARA